MGNFGRVTLNFEAPVDVKHEQSDQQVEQRFHVSQFFRSVQVRSQNLKAVVPQNLCRKNFPSLSAALFGNEARES